MDPAEGELTVVGIHIEQDGQQKVKAEAKGQGRGEGIRFPPFSASTSTSTSPLAVALWNVPGRRGRLASRANMV